MASGGTPSYPTILATLQDTLEDAQKRAKKQARELQDLEEELESAQNQLRDINSQCSDASVELQLFMSLESERKLAARARQHASDEQAPINRVLTQVIDRHVSRLKREMEMGRLDPDGDGEMNEIPYDEQYVTVMFPHLSEEVLIRTTKSHTFGMLMDDACRYFGRPSHRDRMELVNDRGAVWSPQLMVRQEVAQMDNPAGRIIMRYRVDKVKELVLEPTVPANNSTPMDAGEAGQMHDLEEENISEMGDVKKVRDRALAAARFKHRLAFECLIFTLYISLFMAVLVLRRNLPANLQMTSAVEAALHTEIEPSSGNRYTFGGITTLAQTWAWLQGPLQRTLFPPAPFYAGGTANYSEVASHLVLGQLALVGAVRIKQWRVRPDVSCPPRLPGFAPPCYGLLREGAEATEAFGPNAGGHGGLAGFSLARENVTKQDSAIDGFFYTYGPRAYVLDLATWPRAYDTAASTPPPHARTAATLEAYRQHGWLDAATRGVSVMFTLYNGNTQILLAVRALFEVSPAGRVVPTMSLQAFDRDPMLLNGASRDAPGPKRAAFALMVINYLLFFVAVRKKAVVIQELLAESASPASAMLKFLLSWHTVDMYVLCLFFVSVCVRLAVFNLFPSLDAPPAEATEYIDYFPLAAYIQYAFNLDALILLGATLKTAKYLQLFQEDHMIARVFSFAASDLGFVLALYALLYAAFVILAQQIFGPSLVAFRSPTYTFTELWSMSLGKMTRSQDLFEAAPLWAPLFLFAFVFVMFFLLANLFLAVICNSFSIVREDRDSERRQTRAAYLIAGRLLDEWKPPTFQQQLRAKLEYGRSRVVGAAETVIGFVLTMVGVSSFTAATEAGDALVREAGEAGEEGEEGAADGSDPE